MKRALERYEQYLKRHFNHSSTAIHYRSDIRIFLRSQDCEQLETITPADIDVFVDNQIKIGMCPSTVNRRLASIHSLFEFLASEKPEQLWPNPVIRRRHTLKTGHHLPRDASDEDVARIFAVINSARDEAMFGLMVGAGLRVGEVSALRLSDLEEPPDQNALTKIRIRGKGGKERMVWLTNSLSKTLSSWISARPQVDSDKLFLNWRGKPITINGIQYRLKQHCEAAGVTLSCHQLRHTYARRLAENGMPVESLARLLGHNQLQTTQRYIDGANPALYADFAAIMGKLETTLIRDRKTSPLPPTPPASSRHRKAPEAELEKLRHRLQELPPWLAEALDEYITWRWPIWRAQSAYNLGRNLVCLVRRVWNWLENNRRIDGWETFKRSDLEAWLEGRYQDNVTKTTIRNDMARLRSILRFLESRDYPIDPGLFRVQPPRENRSPLPRYLSEADYGWLEINIMQATKGETYDACLDRAWFLTLAHTGMRLSELLDLRLGDLNLGKGLAYIRGGKPGRDRVAYLTPSLTGALGRYLERRPDLPGEDHVFILRESPPSERTIQRRLATYGKQVGVGVSPHRLRHTFATRLLNQGLPIYSLKKLLGHQNLNTTQIYARVYDETLYKQFQEAMARLEASTIERHDVQIRDPVGEKPSIQG